MQDVMCIHRSHRALSSLFKIACAGHRCRVCFTHSLTWRTC